MVITNVHNVITKRNVVKVHLKVNKRIGIFAGTFDPIHDGHISVANEAVKNLGLESLYFMVEKEPWTHKKPTYIEHRKNMVDIGIAKNATLLQLNIDCNKFTLDKTLPKIEKKFNDSELYFILGADVFVHMNKEQWPGLELLLKHYIVVFERNTITDKEIQNQAKKLGIVVAIIPSLHKSHNSTDIRLQPDKRAIWVPIRVANYIKENNLYGVL